MGRRERPGIFAIFTVIPAAFGVLSVLPFIFYDLVGEKRETMVRELKARKEKAESQTLPESSDHNIIF